MSADPAQSVLDRLLHILDAFDSSSRALTLGELVRRSGLPKTTVHRLAGQLLAARLLEQEASGAYRLGLRLFEIGERVPLHRSLSDLALPIMEDLRAATNARVHLAVLDGVDVVYVRILGTSEVDVVSRPGGRLPAHATGVGKVLLAYSPPAVVRARVDAGLVAFTPRTIVTPGGLTRELEGIRAEGTAYDKEESHLGVSCVAAPVFGPDRRIRAGLSITGPTRAIDPVRLGPAVRTAAFTLTRTLRASGL